VGQGRHSLPRPLPEGQSLPEDFAENLGSTEFWDLHASLDYVGTDAKGRHSAVRQCAAVLKCRRASTCAAQPLICDAGDQRFAC